MRVQFFYQFILICFVFNQTHSMDTSAKQAILIDINNMQVILDKNSNELMKPASMAKLMTIYIVFERLKNKQLSLDDKFFVSEKAWKKRGSRSFLEPGQNVSIADLLRGVIVQSGNDAAIVLAEGISGNEDIFADLMNSYANQMGMNNTVFKNATGWPDPDQYTTAKDLAILSVNIIKTFPDLYKIFSELTFKFNGIKQGNRNPILYNKLVFGADGLKTGHTEESGYGLVGSAIRDDLRFIIVLNGMKTQRQRKEEASRLLNSAFREFKQIKFYSAGDTVIKASVWLGKESYVPLVIKEDLNLLLNSIERREMSVLAKWNDPIQAPIYSGQEVGKLSITIPNKETIEISLYSGFEVEKQGIIMRMGSTINYLIWGSMR